VASKALEAGREMRAEVGRDVAAREAALARRNLLRKEARGHENLVHVDDSFSSSWMSLLGSFFRYWKAMMIQTVTTVKGRAKAT